MNSDPVKIWEKARNVIADYGDVLVKTAENCVMVADISRLPYPKGVIKAVLVMALVCSEPDHRDDLIAGYLSLAYWQEGVGEQDVVLKIRRDILPPLSDRTAWIAASDKLGISIDTYRKWDEVIKTEQEALLYELETRGLLQSEKRRNQQGP